MDLNAVCIYAAAINIAGAAAAAAAVRRRPLPPAAVAAAMVLSLAGGAAGVLAASLLSGSRKDSRVMSVRVFSACLLIIWASALLLALTGRGGALSFDLRGFFAAHRPFGAYLAAVNAVSLAVFGVDKLRAVRGGRRVREAVLLLLSFAGGCAGGLLGILLFRHKTRKRYFFPGLLLVAAADLSVIVLLMNIYL